MVLDAGPLIGLVDRDDHYHTDARRGFEQLAASRTQLVVPLPIVFEVYKWLAYEISPLAARDGFALMRRACHIRTVEPSDLDEIVGLAEGMPLWSGSLEDALVAMVGLRTDTPVWTLNYRDLAAFPNLRFWTPG